MVDRPHKRYTEDDLAPILKGEVALPNFEEGSVLTDVAGLTRYWSGGRGGKVNLGDGQSNRSALYFLNRTQANGLDGSGVVLFADGWTVVNGSQREVARLGQFSICKHEKVGTGSHYDSMRGWHPGQCKHCGLDMSVDSGD